MRLDYTKRFQEINERMDHLKCYYPFFKFYTSSFVRNLGYDVPYLALDVLTLLIENGKLHGRSVRMDEIEIHMENVLKEMYPSQDFDSKEVSKTVLNILETSSSKGEAYHFEYCDPIRKRQVDHYIHLIEYDVNEKAYRITDAGLDFMISIKELPEESKISISLILFKKQIEHGSFLTALNTVRELNLEVVRKKNKKQHLLDKMMYGGLEVVDDFSKFTHEVLHQLKQENELFEQVRHTLRELTENREDIINNPNIKVKEEDFVIIKEISSELENGFTLHSGLIKDYTGLPSEYERIYQIRLNSLFDRKYHFQETLENHIRANLLNDVHVIEMQPMLLPRIPKLFSLFRIFESQSIIREKTEIFEIRLKEDWSEEKLIDDIVDERQLYNFIVYAYVLLESFSNTKEVGLESFLDLIADKIGPNALQNKDLIPFLLALNNSSEDMTVHESGIYPESSVKREPYETVFDLIELKNSRSDNYELIEEALLKAHESLNKPHFRLRIISTPEDLVNIGGKHNVYISNLKLVME